MNDAPQALIADPGLSWAARDSGGRRALLTEILAQVSREALQGESVEAVLRGIVNGLLDRLPVAIGIILLNNEGSHFVQEVSAGELDLDMPVSGPWRVKRALDTASRKLQTANCKLQTANCKLQTANCKLQTANNVGVL